MIMITCTCSFTLNTCQVSVEGAENDWAHQVTIDERRNHYDIIAIGTNIATPRLLYRHIAVIANAFIIAITNDISINTVTSTRCPLTYLSPIFNHYHNHTSFHRHHRYHRRHRLSHSHYCRHYWNKSSQSMTVCGIITVITITTNHAGSTFIAIIIRAYDNQYRHHCRHRSNSICIKTARNVTIINTVTKPPSQLR